ncbi:MAG: DUF4870 domain-containing protein [Armatimonadetes bacterium]|nr:DUF4870 domain-containing protein [Armatimonadota bacterium]
MRQSTEKLWAMVSHLGMALIPYGGAIGALVIFLVFKDRSRFIAHHSYHSMWFLICTAVAMSVLGFVGLTWFAGAVYFLRIVMAAFGSYSALSGGWYEYPVTSKFVKRALR